jgi:deoxyribose-phosphate aldolase
LKSWVDQILDTVRDHLAESLLYPERNLSGYKSDNLQTHTPNDYAPMNEDQTHFSDSEDSANIASKIDHTLLKPDATEDQIRKTCTEAIENRFATVCVNSCHIRLVADLLKGSSTKPITVVGFPLGAASTAAKVFEAKEAIRSGAQEIDMVISIGALKGRNFRGVFDDIYQVVKASRPHLVKVILETSSLDQDQKIIGCALAKAAGAAFVKTSTGFGAGGATVEDVALMRRVVGPEIGVKASGGIRTYDDALKMIQAGANRIGASSSVAIVNEEKQRLVKSQSSPDKHVGQTECTSENTSTPVVGSTPHSPSSDNSQY